MKNIRGVSAIVTTVIMLALVLIAVAVVWAVISNVITSGAEDVDWVSRCNEVGITVNSVANTSSGEYTISITREGRGTTATDGADFVIYNATDNTAVINDAGFDLSPLETNTTVLTSTGVNGTATKAEVTPYFTDDSGNKRSCATITWRP